MAYTPRKKSSMENAEIARSDISAILPDDDIGPVSFYWRHRVSQVSGGELVQATVWSSKQKLQGRTADDGRYGFIVRATEQTKDLADEGQILPRPVYLDIVHMDGIKYTKQIGDSELLVLME